MICPDCGGRGLVTLFSGVVPCETCQGSGVAYCCEGHQAEPEPQKEEER